MFGIRRAVTAVVTVAVGAAVVGGAAPASAAEGDVIMDVLKVVDGEMVVETITVPASKADATEEKLEDGVGVLEASPQVKYDVEARDPYWDEQDPIGTSKAKEVWNQSRGSGIIVAVLDTAPSIEHPDMIGRVLPGADMSGGNNDPWHGYGAASVIAANAENGIGSAGIAPEAQVMPIRVCNEGGCTSSSVSRGVLWAADHGADVINMSLGGAGYSDVTAGAIRYALDKGIIVVASSGNDGQNGNPVTYPAANSGVIAVGATTPTGEPADWAVNGWQVDISTVGESVLLAMPGNAGYSNGSGTSFSGPAVAGAVALLKSKYPNLTAEEIQAALQAGADSSNNWNRGWGAGRLDLPAAFAAAARSSAPAVTGGTGSITASWDAQPGAASYTVRIDGVEKATVNGTTATITGLTNGTQVAVDVQANNGERSKATLGTVGTDAPGTPILNSANIRGSATSAIVDLNVRIEGTPAPKYSLIRDGVSMGTVTIALSNTAKTVSFGIGAMPTVETKWQLRGVDGYARTSKVSNAVYAGAGKPAGPGAVTGLEQGLRNGKLLLDWDDMGSQISYRVELDGKVVAEPQTPGVALSKPAPNVTHTYSVKAVDNWGQTGAAATIDVNISAKPTITTAPAVLGDLEATKTVRTPDQFDGATHVVHNWYACTPGTNSCSRAGGGVTHYITPSEVGKELYVEAIGKNAAGETTVQSTRSNTIVHAKSRPVLTVVPKIEGTIHAGQWVRTPDQFDGDYSVVHNWYACELTTNYCTRVGGGVTFFIDVKYAGKRLQVDAVAKNPAGTTTAVSAKSKVVTSNVVPPVLLTAPAIEGTVKPWQTLRTPDAYHNATHGVVHNWYGCDIQTDECTRIGGGVTLQLNMSHVGKQIYVEAVAKNYKGTSTHKSPRSAVVTSNVTPPVLLKAPVAYGTPHVGEILRTPDEYHNATHGVVHNWYACHEGTNDCRKIGGGVTFQIPSSAAGKEIYVEVVAKNYVGTSSAKSKKTMTVSS